VTTNDDSPAILGRLGGCSSEFLRVVLEVFKSPEVVKDDEDALKVVAVEEVGEEDEGEEEEEEPREAEAEAERDFGGLMNLSSRRERVSSADLK